MSLVAEDLPNKFDNIQDGWVVLVGDGKTYKHLKNNTTQHYKNFYYSQEIGIF